MYVLNDPGNTPPPLSPEARGKRRENKSIMLLFERAAGLHSSVRPPPALSIDLSPVTYAFMCITGRFATKMSPPIVVGYRLSYKTAIVCESTCTIP